MSWTTIDSKFAGIFFPLVLTGSPPLGTEQQLWQCASSLTCNHNQRFRISKDAQRYVPLESNIMSFESIKFSQRGDESRYGIVRAIKSKSAIVFFNGPLWGGMYFFLSLYSDYFFYTHTYGWLLPFKHNHCAL